MVTNLYRLTSDQVKDQPALIVKDSTSYFAWPASCYGVALFYSRDKFLTLATADLSSPAGEISFGPWMLDGLDNQSTYDVIGLWAEKFRAYEGQTIKEGTIVFHLNQFWVKTAAGESLATLLDPPGENPGFARVAPGLSISFDTLQEHDLVDATDMDVYRLFQASTGSGGIDPVGGGETNTVIDDPLFKIVKQECYQYRVEKITTGNWIIKVYRFSEYVAGGDPIQVLDMGSVTPAIIDLPQDDNVYLLVILFDDTVNQVSFTEYIPVYEYCALEECFQLLIKDILCNETVCDPALDCNQDSLFSTEGLKRTDLMKISVLYFEMIMNIHAEQMKYLNKFTLEDDRQKRLLRASDVMARIKSVLTHCGICGTGTVGSSGCENCG